MATHIRECHSPVASQTQESSYIKVQTVMAMKKPQAVSEKTDQKEEQGSLRLLRDTVEDIYVPPKKIADHESTISELVLGDLHANPIKLIYFLLAENCIKLKDKRMLRLAAIYQKGADNWLSLKDIANFNKRISKITLTRTSLPRIILVGDELCDRGVNDLLVLLLFGKLSQIKLNYSILLSNHGYEFIKLWKKSTKRTLKAGKPPKAKTKPCDSWDGLTNYIHTLALAETTSPDEPDNFKKMSYEEINDLVENYYSTLKLLDYSLSLDGKSITIYSHAIINHRIIELIANEFEVEYHDHSAQALADTIDKINEFFLTKLQANKLKKYFKKHESTTGEEIMNPFRMLIWNRSPDNLPEKDSALQFPAIYVHGHIGQTTPFPGYINLDSDLGKTLEEPAATDYIRLTTKNRSLSPTEKIELSLSRQEQESEEAELTPSTSTDDSFSSALAEDIGSPSSNPKQKKHKAEEELTHLFKRPKKKSEGESPSVSKNSKKKPEQEITAVLKRRKI